MIKKLASVLSLLILSTLLLVGCTSINVPDNNNTTTDNNTNTSKKDEQLVATIYCSDDQAMNLVKNEIKLSEINENTLLHELKILKVIPQDTTIINFNTYTDENGLKVGIIDFSQEFYNTNLGSSAESLMLNSIANTYMDNLNLDKFKLLINGSNYESGHILLEDDDYFTRDK